jgi:hypothetical protein
MGINTTPAASPLSTSSSSPISARLRAFFANCAHTVRWVGEAKRDGRPRRAYGCSEPRNMLAESPE